MWQSWRKKPVVIQAYRFYAEKPCNEVELLDVAVHTANGVFVGKIRTIEDTDDSAHYVRDGDYIIKGVAGEIYACEPSVFMKTYEFVGE